MRTTLDIDDDVLRAVKELARMRRSTAGKVMSELARNSLTPGSSDERVRNGVPLLRARPEAGPLTPETVARLLDDE